MALYIRYAVAAFALAISLAVSLTLQSWLGLSAPYPQFFPAILLASWYGGFGPGMFVTLGAAAATTYFFLLPIGFAIDSPTDRVLLLLFVATGTGSAWIGQLFRNAEKAYGDSAALAAGRAERLAAILRTAVDGCRSGRCRWTGYASSPACSTT